MSLHYVMLPNQVRRSTSPSVIVARVPLDHWHFKCFCIADAEDPWKPCSEAPKGPISFEDLAERASDRGGFTVSLSNSEDS